MSAGMSGTTEAFSWKDWFASCIYGSCMIIQMVLTYFRYNGMGLDGLANTGWLVMTVSAVFGWMPFYTLRERGGVPEGESYMKTTKLVETGVYSVVRHPQYLAGVYSASPSCSYPSTGSTPSCSSPCWSGRTSTATGQTGS